MFLFLSFFPLFATCLSSDVVSMFDKNWSLQFKSADDREEEKKIEKYYILRCHKYTKSSFQVRTFSKENLSNPLFIFNVSIMKNGILEFRDVKNNSAEININRKEGNFLSATGRFSKFIYHLFLKLPNTLRITLIDRKSNRIFNANLFREVNTTPESWVKRNMPFAATITIILFTELLLLWNQYRMMIAQKRHAIKRKAIFRQEELKRRMPEFIVVK